MVELTHADSPPVRPLGAARSGRRLLADRAWPLALYTGLSLLLFGLPVIGHLGSRVLASDPVDSSQFMWFLAWWPHALLHGLNPFVTHDIFYPEGVNLTWSAAMPGPGILLAPITLAFGPPVTYNVVMLASPALSAWTMFLLCRHVTTRMLPSLLGGYLFGFAPYMLTNITGAPNLALVALVPLLALLVLRRLEGSISPSRFVALTALTLAGQYLTSSEVLATSTVFGAVALGFGFLLVSSMRPVILALFKPLALAYLGAVVLISPFLGYFFLGHHYPPGAVDFSTDLSAFVLPPHLVALQLHAGPPLHGSNPNGYLGIPLLALVALILWRGRGRPLMRLLALFLATTGIASLGSHLILRGNKTGVPLPWLLFSKLPVLRYAIPLRFSVFLMLAVALVVAIGLSETARAARDRAGAAKAAGVRWGLAALSVAFILPAAGDSAWKLPIADPPFFTHHAFRAYLSSRDHVLTVPVYGPNMRWTADAGFPFPLSAGYSGQPFLPSYARFQTFQTLLTGQLTPDYAAALRRFVAAKHVTAILVADGYLGPWRKLFGTLGVHPVHTDGVLLYRLRG